LWKKIVEGNGESEVYAMKKERFVQGALPISSPAVQQTSITNQGFRGQRLSRERTDFAGSDVLHGNKLRGFV
jgi:hypothetical protein